MRSAQVAITGLGWVSAAGLGCGPADFALRAGPLPEIRRAQLFAAQDRHFGRLDDFSRLGLAGIALALRDAGLDASESFSDGEVRARDIGVVVTTNCGCVHTDLAFWETVNRQTGHSDSPRLFVYTLPSVFLGEAALRLGLGGPTYALDGGPEIAGGLAALCEAVDMLVQGECPVMLAGMCDLPPPPGLCLPGRALPGAVFFVLEMSPRAQYPAYAWLTLERDGSVRADSARPADLIALAGSLTPRSSPA